MKLLASDIQTKEVLDWKGLHLFHFHTSSCSQKTRLVLTVKGVSWDSHLVDLRNQENYTQWFLGINPRGLLPVLVDDGQVHIESNDIIEYLDGKFPNPPLVPEGKAELAHELLDQEEDLHLDLRTLTFRFMFPPTGKPPKDPESLEVYKKHNGTVQGQKDPEKAVQLGFWQEAAKQGITDEKVRESVARFHTALTELDAILEEQPLILGNHLTLVDISWYIYVSRLLLCGYPIEEQHPHVARWHASLNDRPDFSREVTPPAPLAAAITEFHSKQAETGTRLIDILSF